MNSLYNPKKHLRSELPECDKRLLVRKHSLISQRFTIKVNEQSITLPIGKLIDKYPLAIYRHVYEYRTRELIRLTLCSRGLEKLWKMMETHHPDIFGKLRDRKRQNKARLNLKAKGII